MHIQRLWISDIFFLSFSGDIYDYMGQRLEITEVSPHTIMANHLFLCFVLLWNNSQEMLDFTELHAFCWHIFVCPFLSPYYLSFNSTQRRWTSPSTRWPTDTSYSMITPWWRQWSWRTQRSTPSSDCWLSATPSWPRRRKKVSSGLVDYCKISLLLNCMYHYFMLITNEGGGW